MAEKIREPKLPRGFSRFALRLPIWLFHAHLGWVLGKRFVLLTHFGRKSGLIRQTVLEVVRYDRAKEICIAASGWGEKSDWVQNITANPKIVYQIQNRPKSGKAARLSPDDAAKELYEYARNYRLAFRELTRFMGYSFDGSDEDIRAIGRTLPMFIFQPYSEE